EAAAAGRRPRERVALPVGDRDDRVVERRVDVRHRVENLALDLLAALARLFGHTDSSLLPDRTARALTGARVRARSLAARRQPAAMADAPVAAEIHQPLDVHRDLAAEIALDRELRDRVAQPGALRLREIPHRRRRIDAGRLAGEQRAASPDPV